MSDYGLRVKDASGNTILTFTDRITRFRYSVIASSDSSGNITLNDIDGLLSVEFGIPINSGAFESPHSVSRSGTTLSWSPNNYYVSAYTLVFIFLYT